jgi:hypothetical protein
MRALSYGTAPVTDALASIQAGAVQFSAVVAVKDLSRISLK